MCPLYLKFHAFRVCCAWKITVENVGHGALYIGRNANTNPPTLKHQRCHSVKKAKAKTENIYYNCHFLANIHQKSEQHMNAAAATASILRPPMVLLMAMLKPITFFSRKAATAFLFIYIVTSSIHTWLCCCTEKETMVYNNK